jgi:hypothetical protein
MSTSWSLVLFVLLIMTASATAAMNRCSSIRNATECLTAGCSPCMGNVSMPSTFVGCYDPHRDNCCLAADTTGPFGAVCALGTTCCQGLLSVSCCSSRTTCCSDGLFGISCVPNGFFPCSGCSAEFCPDAGKCEYCLGSLNLGCQMPNGTCIPASSESTRRNTKN